MRSRLSALWTRLRQRAGDQAGSATVFAIGFAIVLFLTAGLVIDGGLAINKRMRVADDAEQAARVGANQIDVLTFRTTGQLVVDQNLALQRIGAYLGDLGYGGGQWSASITGNQVNVRVTDVSETFILGIIRDDFPVRADADAEPQTGP